MSTVCSKKSCAEEPEVQRSYDKSGFVLLTDVIPDALLEIRYFSTFNFVGERILDMGGAFDFFGELSHSLHTEGLTEAQINNRAILRKAMTDNGFKPLAEEWWHFSLENEPYPNTYFDFPITSPSSGEKE